MINACIYIESLSHVCARPEIWYIDFLGIGRAPQSDFSKFTLV